MTAPLFTIGIPTYNRASLLRESLASALAQTISDVEVIVSDNCSTDETEQVVREFGQRVQYHRNDSNIGPAANFARLVSLARGKYFSWLQDDDLIHYRFAERATQAFCRYPDAVVYLAHTAVSPSPKLLQHQVLYGPPFTLDWCAGVPRRLDGRLLTPFALLSGLGVPPAVAFCTDVLRNFEMNARRDHPLLWERTILASVGSIGAAVADPYIGGFHRRHEHQYHRKSLAPITMEEWKTALHRLGQLSAGAGDEWQSMFQECLQEAPLAFRRAWLRRLEQWPEKNDLWRTVYRILGPMATVKQAKGRSIARTLVQPVIPPILWASLRWLLVRNAQK